MTSSLETRRIKKARLESTTGVHWDFYSVSGKYKFVPIVTQDTLSDETFSTQVLRALPRSNTLGRGHDFETLASLTGLPLTDILSATKFLIETRQVTPLINRAGSLSGVYISLLHNSRSHTEVEIT